MRKKNYIFRLSNMKSGFIKKVQRKVNIKLYSQKIYPKLFNKKKRFLNYKHFNRRLNLRFLNKKKFQLLNFLIPKQTVSLKKKLKKKLLLISKINLLLTFLTTFKEKIKRINKKRKLKLLKLIFKIRKILIGKKLEALKYYLFKQFIILKCKKKITQKSKQYKKFKFKLKLIKVNKIKKKKNKKNLNLLLKKKIFLYNLKKFKQFKFKKFQKPSLHLFKLTFLIKQKLKNFYGSINFKQLFKLINKYYPYANQKYKKFIFSLLESRLDILMFRMGLINSIQEAQQLIAHGFVFVNNKQIRTKNFFLNPGDMLQVKQFFQNNKKNLLKLKLKNFLISKVSKIKLLNLELQNLTTLKDNVFNSNINRLNKKLFIQKKSCLPIFNKFNKTFQLLKLSLKIKNLLSLLTPTIEIKEKIKKMIGFIKNQVNTLKLLMNLLKQNFLNLKLKFTKKQLKINNKKSFKFKRFKKLKKKRFLSKYQKQLKFFNLFKKKKKNYRLKKKNKVIKSHFNFK